MALPPRITTRQTFLVALILSAVCSLLVSSTVIFLKDKQEQNMLIFKRANVLKAAGFQVKGSQVNQLFEQRIELRYFTLETGEYVDAPKDPQFDSVDAAKNPEFSQPIDPSKDLARIKRRSAVSEVYFLRSDDENSPKINRVILPVRGKGLWSTMKGFMALDPESFDVLGLSFYSHAETPGLGGEIDNPKWLNTWPGKKIYNAKGQVALKVL
ncbi:MAG: NADH:ubiquinone reductase (Na(+)-transporting) subunit C, partial [Proteobacteria bacterium]|nr:NADH:ubiquinone reductase (Na(+)-transporting) subunit C [Pseudomonadota bacterium]